MNFPDRRNFSKILVVLKLKGNVSIQKWLAPRTVKLQPTIYRYFLLTSISFLDMVRHVLRHIILAQFFVKGLYLLRFPLNICRVLDGTQ